MGGVRDVFPVRPQPVKDWQKLQAVYEMARAVGIGRAVEYGVGEEWWVTGSYSGSREP